MPSGLSSSVQSSSLMPRILNSSLFSFTFWISGGLLESGDADCCWTDVSRSQSLFPLLLLSWSGSGLNFLLDRYSWYDGGFFRSVGLSCPDMGLIYPSLDSREGLFPVSVLLLLLDPDIGLTARDIWGSGIFPASSHCSPHPNAKRGPFISQSSSGGVSTVCLPTWVPMATEPSIMSSARWWTGIGFTSAAVRSVRGPCLWKQAVCGACLLSAGGASFGAVIWSRVFTLAMLWPFRQRDSSIKE